MRKLVFAASVIALLLLSGCIHLTRESDCTGIDDQDERDGCYFDAAVAYAIVDQSSSQAVATCYKVEGSTFGNERDQCFRKVAEIMNDPTICNHIEPSLLEEGVSSYVVRRLCENGAEPRGQSACSSIFVIAPLLALALFAYCRKN